MRRQTIVKRREFKAKQRRDIGYIILCTLLFASIGYHFKHQQIIMQSPIGEVHAQTVTQRDIFDSNTNPTQEQIESYIRRIFTEDPETAVAISRTECPNLPQYHYPKCHLFTSVERSVGVMQINIMSNQAKVHWSQIPGTTFDEKVTWLENPFNNVLMAHWIYSTSGFEPWSTFTSQAYLKNMEN